MDFLFLLVYLALLALTLYFSRSTAWLVLSVVAGVSIIGGVVSLVMDLGQHWNRTGLQFMLLLALALPALFAFFTRSSGRSITRHQVNAIWAPFLALLVFFLIVVKFFTNGLAFIHPVSFFIGHAVAEDNAKWLDFTSQLASGNPISQGVPMGGPLELVLVFMATVMGVVSQLVLGGYNQVAVAGNTVIFGQFLMVILAPLALAPLAEARLRGARKGIAERIPAPLIWLGALVLVSANLVATGYGHLTFQFTVLIAALWSSVFISEMAFPRARLISSLIIVTGMTVWLPLNVLAVIILLGWLVVLIRRFTLDSGRRRDVVGLGLWLVVAICVWQPIKSSLLFIAASSPTASGTGSLTGGGNLVSAGISALVPAGLADSTLFAASGGTDQTGPILAIIAVIAAVGAGFYLSRQPGGSGNALYVRFMPVILLAAMALMITMLDAWATGGGPHYGSMKFTFMAAVVVSATCIPLALLLFDRNSLSVMTPLRWIAVVAVLFLLVVDTIVPRAIAAARPEQWSPPIPFNNPQSFWWPADVNGSGTQSIGGNPVGCVYLPQGAKVPSALLASQLSDAQRVYSCTRLLSGLAGVDTEAQPLVDWLRREWLTNTPAWSDSYDSLAAMPASVLDKPMILLDDGSNVIGLDTMRSLLMRFPRDAGKTPAISPASPTSTASVADSPTAQ